MMQALLSRIDARACQVGVIGLGYVGLPLALEIGRSGFGVVGFDSSDDVVRGLMAGCSHVDGIDSTRVKEAIRDGRLTATTDLTGLGACDVIAICVPTPLNKLKDPNLDYVIGAAEAIAPVLRPGQLVVLESTTYPGTTREIVLPILERSGLRVGEEFFLCFSPERVDPGNSRWTTRNTPKLLGGITGACTEVGVAFYRAVVDQIVPVASVEVAELAKVYENTFRMINIALANELAQVCAKLRLDVWDVIDAAATKPFGFMKFTPGPGSGGHCIPLDPHYLSWRMQALDFKTRMIELASEINARMPAFVVQHASDALNDESRAVRGADVLVVGVAYKRDVSDFRESPALEVIRLLREKGATVRYHDPYCPALPLGNLIGGAPSVMESVSLTEDRVRQSDLVLIATDHSA
ncbi:MAG TPA: nucleotide sugar dehydrogenase, partial [Thermomicrobiales bacterium]|nr:nucleotide sugar dehydrogenase [Thermomicrobiales bacterium]